METKVNVQVVIEALFPEKVQAAQRAIELLDELDALLAKMNKGSDDLWDDPNDLWSE